MSESYQQFDKKVNLKVIVFYNTDILDKYHKIKHRALINDYIIAENIKAQSIYYIVEKILLQTNALSIREVIAYRLCSLNELYLKPLKETKTRNIFYSHMGVCDV